jgi:hypothetical protein
MPRDAPPRLLLPWRGKNDWPLSWAEVSGQEQDGEMGWLHTGLIGTIGFFYFIFWRCSHAQAQVVGGDAYSSSLPFYSCLPPPFPAFDLKSPTPSGEFAWQPSVRA